MPDVNSDELFRLATERVFKSLKLIREAQRMIADARKLALKENSSSFTQNPRNEALEAMEHHLRIIYGGDSLGNTLNNVAHALAVELVSLDGVALEFQDVKVKVERVEIPQGIDLVQSIMAQQPKLPMKNVVKYDGEENEE